MTMFRKVSAPPPNSMRNPQLGGKETPSDLVVVIGDGVDEGSNANLNAQLAITPSPGKQQQHQIRRASSGGSRRRSSTGRRSINLSRNQQAVGPADSRHELQGGAASPQLPPTPMPPGIPALCEGMPLEMFVKIKEMEAEEERKRKEEEERYALLHPKVKGKYGAL